MDEGARDGNHARVRHFLVSSLTRAHRFLTYTYTCSLCSDAGFMRRIWESHDASAGEVETGGSGSARVFTLLISSLKRLVTSRPALLGVSVQMQGVGVPANDTLPHSSSHSLDSVAGMVATAASATVSNVVGMMGTEAGLSVQSAAMKVQW
jgi:hypothetical protein